MSGCLPIARPPRWKWCRLLTHAYSVQVMEVNMCSWKLDNFWYFLLKKKVKSPDQTHCWCVFCPFYSQRMYSEMKLSHKAIYRFYSDNVCQFTGKRKWISIGVLLLFLPFLKYCHNWPCQSSGGGYSLTDAYWGEPLDMGEWRISQFFFFKVYFILWLIYIIIFWVQ